MGHQDDANGIYTAAQLIFAHVWLCCKRDAAMRAACGWARRLCGKLSRRLFLAGGIWLLTFPVVGKMRLHIQLLTMAHYRQAVATRQQPLATSHQPIAS
ncbi:hypothetical protein AWZ03_011280 [Drosophila navojoa]|uniref:Uncharacterized protein n=1 Tax=Drosophila navojoa TaxID=7232 RepID=A0A484B0T4_DRONA|nr:hypothetical protein AWZ03_011280 [Drosophila navojoa]